MTSRDTSSAATGILRDLVTSLAQVAEVPSRRSLGVLRLHDGVDQPPAHCVASCLGGQCGGIAERGCAWLHSVHAGAPDNSLAHGGRCEKGFEVAARPFEMGDGVAWLVSVDGALPGADSTPPAPPHRPEAPPLAAFGALSRLVDQMNQLADENVGLANEVLGSYEQLNLVFDIVRQIINLTERNQIEQVLAQRLAEVLGARSVFIVEGAMSCREYDHHGAASTRLLDSALEGALRSLSERARAERRVLVEPIAGGQVIAGLLELLDGRLNVVVIVREGVETTFTAGNMLLIESVLSFGGQLMRNSELHEKLHRLSFEVTRALVAAIDKKDRYTSGHSERVGFLAALTGRQLALPEEQLQALEWAGLLHDVGKIGIREEVLNKEGPLTADEFEHIKQHPVMGYEILRPIETYEEVLASVLHHHENPDGSGYPHGLNGDSIPLFARIIHVVDIFDALTSTRSYRPAFSIEKALDIIRKDIGVKVDETVTSAFLEALDRYRTTQPEEFARMYGECQQPAHTPPASDGGQP